ncbi:hypothetical protein QTG56_25740 (plasmid) [Rossellomorea sp. AcN35-11]|nr:hypothetical protein QTG56_25740 [Rossellomorea sp. AcN35-11]
MIVYVVIVALPLEVCVMLYEDSKTKEYLEEKAYTKEELVSYHFPAFKREQSVNNFEIDYINTPLEKKYVEFETINGERYSGSVAIEIHGNAIDPYIEYKELELDMGNRFSKDARYDLILHVWNKQQK